MLDIWASKVVNNFLPIGIFMVYPIWLVQVQNTPITAIEAQGWLIAVVGAAMGLIKIALWLRNYKEEKNGGNNLQELKDVFKTSLGESEKILERLTLNDEKLSDSQQMLSTNQQKLAENQLKALENHSKLLEAMTILRMQLQSTEQNIVMGQEKRAITAVAEIKDMIRQIRG